MIVHTTTGYQFIMAAPLCHLAMVYRDDSVGIPHRAQSVGNDDHGSAGIEPVQILHDGFLIARIKGIGGLVQEDIGRIPIHRPGYQNPLLLSLTQTYTVTPYLGIELQRKSHDVILDTCYLCRPEQSILVYLAVIHGYIARDGLGEYHTVLHHHATLTAPPSLVQAVDVSTADGYPSA